MVVVYIARLAPRWWQSLSSLVLVQGCLLQCELLRVLALHYSLRQMENIQSNNGALQENVGEEIEEMVGC